MIGNSPPIRVFVGGGGRNHKPSHKRTLSSTTTISLQLCSQGTQQGQVAAETTVVEHSSVSNNQHVYDSFQLLNTTVNFKAGKTAVYRNNWSRVTSDRWILKTICGYSVEVTHSPFQRKPPIPIKFSEVDTQKIDLEIEQFLGKVLLNMSKEQNRANLYLTFLFGPKKMEMCE